MMQTFWLEFWPNFMATVLGAIIGIPCALWTSRQVAKAAEKRRLATDEAELDALVDSILGALKETGAQLAEFQNLHPGNRMGPRLLDSGTWDALKGRLQRDFAPPELVRRLAFYWLQLARFNQFHRDILEGDLRGVLSGEHLDLSCNFRNSWAQELASSASTLHNDLAAIHNQ